MYRGFPDFKFILLSLFFVLPAEAWQATSVLRRDPCLSTTVARGLRCASGTIYAATFTYGGSVQKRLMTTPGNCTNSTTPTCDGGTDSLLLTWGALGVTTGLTNADTGRSNSAAWAAMSGTEAARYCENMIYAGYSDWYLPAQNEMIAILSPLPLLSGTVAGNEYWTSSADEGGILPPYADTHTAVVRSSSTTEYATRSSATTRRVRCVRQFDGP